MTGATGQTSLRQVPPQGGSPAGQSANRTPGGVNLRFHIDRLTLPHMSSADSARVVAAMQKKLAHLVGRTPRRDWRRLSAFDRLDGGTVPPGAKPEQLGEHLAAQIFNRLK